MLLEAANYVISGTNLIQFKGITDSIQPFFAGPILKPSEEMEKCVHYYKITTKHKQTPKMIDNGLSWT